MTPEHDILQVTPRVEALAALCRSNSRIDPALYRKYDPWNRATCAPM